MYNHVDVHTLTMKRHKPTVHLHVDVHTITMKRHKPTVCTCTSTYMIVQYGDATSQAYNVLKV